jgi:hypothetical protein
MLVQIFLSVSLFFAFLTTTNHRADEIAFDIAQPTASIEETLSWVDQADFDKAEKTYQEVKKWWTMEKQAAKKKNTTVAQQID